MKKVVNLALVGILSVAVIGGALAFKAKQVYSGGDVYTPVGEDCILSTQLTTTVGPNAFTTLGTTIAGEACTTTITVTTVQ